MKKRIIILLTVLIIHTLYSSDYKQQDSSFKSGVISLYKENNNSKISIDENKKLSSFGKKEDQPNLDLDNSVIHKKENKVDQSGLNVQKDIHNHISPCTNSKAKQASLIKIKSKYDQILEEKTAPVGMTTKEVKDLLLEKIRVSNQKIDEGLYFKSGKTHQLFGRKAAVILNHIVNISPEVDKNRSISLQGGHMYETLEAFKSAGFLEKAISSKNTKNNCWLFDGYDVFSGQRFYKTAFPKGWKVEDIYQAIITSNQVAIEPVDINGRQLIRVSVRHKNNPEFKARLILYRRPKGDIWEIMTAFPEL